MRRTVRTTLAVAAVFIGLTVAAPASPAAAEGRCYDIIIYVTNPPAVITVCPPI